MRRNDAGTYVHARHWMTCAKSVVAIMILCSLFACSATRKLPANEKLYIGADVRIDDEKIKAKKEKALEKELETLVRPKPNKSFLGIRYKLLFYNMVDSVGTKKGLKHFIKNKLGEPPVVFSDVSLEANEEIICNRLQNRGYFDTRCSSDIKERDRKVKVIFTAKPGPQYHIRKVDFKVDSLSVLGAAVKKTEDHSFLKPGESYDLDIIKAERERIDARLKENGFYFFSPDDILVQVDSTVGEHQVDLFVRLKESTPTKARKVYHINNTYIFPDYSISDDEVDISQAEKHYNFYISDPEDKWKPLTFQHFVYFNPGDVYNRTDHNVAISNMVSMGAFKFVKNKFVETGDSARLNVFYYLTPFPKKSIRAEISGRKTDADFIGTELTLNWRNRSIFRGAELLTLSGYVGTDIQSGDNETLSNRSYFKFGAQGAISVPRFITPFKIKNYSAFVPKSRVILGYDFLNRKNSYTLNSFRSLAGYNWKEDSRKQHELNVIDVNFVHAINVTDEYAMLAMADPTLRKAIEDQFTIGSSYRYTYSNTAEVSKTHTTYYLGGLDLSGNVAGLLTGANIKEGKEKLLFGAPFSQYVKLENDFRYYWRLSENARWANRIFAGAGYAYGNSLNMPFVKQFFVGGSNSIRAFRARTVGPGTYYAPDDPNTTTNFTADQSGDIKLEFNTEFRQKLIGFLHGALFVDAGNIWLVHQDDNPGADKPGALFSKSFMDDLLVGGGAGLRFDLSFVILRFDLAFPLRKPWKAADERWVIDEIDFGDPVWRKKNLVFHVAIGYPF